MPVRHQGLGVSYNDRYRRTGGDLQDLETAIRHNLAAVESGLENHPQTSGMYHSLAVSYGDKYGRYGALQDLEVTIMYNLAAVEATPEGHPQLPGRLQGLAISYSHKLEEQGTCKIWRCHLHMGW